MNATGTSTRPYLIRALYEWCTDNGFTPYVAVAVDHTVQVPREYVKNNEIVLNIGFDATSSLTLGNEYIEFKARFGGIAREILVPINHVIAIYARENGQGMAFPLESEPEEDGMDAHDELQNASLGKRQSDTASTAQSLTEAGEATQTPEHKIMQLVESAADDSVKAGEQADGTASVPPEPPTPPRPRPSLKRVK
ncbi:MAG: ClpXP protease specificity-enhancing factor [Polaromonas sp.]